MISKINYLQQQDKLSMQFFNEIDHASDLRKLRDKQIAKILDNCAPEYTEELGDVDALIQRFLLFLKDRLQPIRFESKPLLLWNFTLFCLIYYAFLDGLFSIFILSVLERQREVQIGFSESIKYVTVVALLVDMVLVRWRTQNIVESGIVATRARLLKNYLRYFFLIDLMIIIVIILDISEVKINFWKLLIYVKVAPFIKIKNQIGLCLKGHINLEFIFKIVKLLFFVAFWSFFFASVYVTIELFYYFQKGFYYQYGLLWIKSHPAVDYMSIYDKFEWYVWFQYALFFVMQMVRGAGMGVLSPRCPPSMLWYCICNITMTVLWWYFTAKIIGVVTHFNKDNSMIDEMSEVKINDVISQNNFKKYINFLRISTLPDIQTTYFQPKIQAIIVQPMYQDFNYAFKQHFLLRFRFLHTIVSDTFSADSFKFDLAQIIKSKISFENQLIYKRLEICQPRLYLSELSHLVLFDDAIHYAERLAEWALVGVRAFFIEPRPLFNMVATKIATMDYIEKAEFISVLKKYHNIYESYCQRIDSIKIDKETTQSIDLTCFHCSEYHLTENCSRANINKKSIISRYNLKKQDRRVESMKNVVIQNKRRKGYFRKAFERKKIRDKGIKINQVDGYKRRDFSYVSYNIGVEEFKRRQLRLRVDSEVFKRYSVDLLDQFESMTVIPTNN